MRLEIKIIGSAGSGKTKMMNFLAKTFMIFLNVSSDLIFLKDEGVFVSPNIKDCGFDSSKIKRIDIQTLEE